MLNLIISLVLFFILVFLIVKEIKKGKHVTKKNIYSKNNIVNYTIILILFMFCIYYLFIAKLIIKEYNFPKNNMDIVISAEGISDKSESSHEVSINAIIVDNKVYYPSQLIKDGFWEGLDGGGLNYREYDTIKDITREITLSVPKGINQTIVFQKNKYRGKVGIRVGEDFDILDLYSESSNINSNYHNTLYNSNEELEFFRIDNNAISYDSYFRYYCLVVILLFMYLLYLIINNNSSEKISEVRNISLIILFAFFTCLTFTNNPWTRVHFWGDSDFFSLVGKLLYRNKYILYRDICDIKGPFLYFLEYVGYVIFKSYIGMWFLEFINTILFFIISYKISRYFIDKNLSLISVIISFIELSYYLKDGNTNETFVLSMFAYSLYIFIQYIYDRELKNIHVLIVGIFFTLTMLIKLPYVVFYIPFIITIFISNIINKRYKLVLSCISLFILGVIVTILPFVIYFIYNNIWQEAINYIYFYSLGYTKHNADNNFLNLVFLERIPSIMYIVSIQAYSIFIILSKRKVVSIKLFISNTLAFIISIVVCGLPRTDFDHYYIIVFPTLLLGNIVIIKIMEYLNIDHKEFKLYICTTMIILLMLFNKSSIINNIGSRWWIFNANNDKMRISYYVNSFTNQDDKIITYGLDSSIYIYSNRLPASRHPVPLFTVHNYNMRNDVYRDLKKIYNDKKLGAIIVRNDVYNDDIEFFEFFKGILSNYRVIYRNDIMTLYVKK